MVSIAALWLPILLSAVAVFVASSIIHMFLGYHRADYRQVPAEEDLQAALRKMAIPAGDYMVPCAGAVGTDPMKDPAFVERWKAGPRVLMTVMPGGEFSMGPQFIQWFVYCIVVGIATAYLSGHAVAAGAAWRAVFRFAGATSFIAYCFAVWPTSIWYKKSWGISLRATLDGLIYGVVTGGIFAWLWPR